MNKKAKKLVFGAGIIGFGFAGIAAATYMLTDTLVKIALERHGIDNIKQTPRTRKIISGIEENVEFMSKRESTAKTLSEISMEEISINATDGTSLVGHLFRCEAPKRILVAMHGWRSSFGEDFGMISDFLHQNHCSVLYVEQRGQGKSGGEHMGFGLIERFDCYEWIKYLNTRFDLPIYLYGVSMGASTVLMTSAFQLPENVKGIIADCGFTSPNAIWKHIANNNMKLAYGVIGKIADDICKRKIKIGLEDFSVPEAMEINKTPVLFIHGTDDHFVPVTMTYENYKKCKSPKKLLVIPGADHAMSYFIDKEQYEKTVLDFFLEFDNYTVPSLSDDVEDK